MARRKTSDGFPGSQPSGTSTKASGWAHKPWLLVLILIAATVIAYQPVWRAGFIWDDNDHLTANPAMTAPRGLQMIWSSLAVSRYYPLTLTSFWIQRRPWGLNPLPYHLVNVGLHAVNGVIVFFLLRRLCVPAAWLASMVWVLHPVNVESVAWVTELKNTQSGLFFFLAILCLFNADARKSRAWYTFALLCALAALLSKPSTVVLPLVLLLCLWWQKGRWQRGDVVRLVPFFALSFAMSVLTIVEQHGEILTYVPGEWKLGTAQRLILAGKAIWFYAGKQVRPLQLTFVYPRWDLDSHSLLSWAPLAGLAILGGVLLSQHRRKWARAGIFGIGYFVIALLPVLGFFDVYYFLYSFVADHFQYLAGIGVIALIVGGSASLCKRNGKPGEHLGVAISVVVLIILGTLTWRQAHAYSDVVTLWEDTLAKNPQCWMADHNLANELLHRGDTQQAIVHWRHALQIKPDLIDARNNLGTVLFRTGHVPEAVDLWEQTLRIKTNDFGAHLNLGVAFLQLRKPREGVAHLEEAVRITPASSEAQFNLGIALLQVGKATEAIDHFQQALKGKPDFTAAHIHLGRALIRVGEIGEAIREYEQAVRIEPRNIEARVDLGLALARAGTGREGTAQLEQALQLQGDSVQAQDRLAWLLATLPEPDGGDPARAVTLAQRVCAATRDQVATCVDTLSVAYAAAGRFDDAVATAERAGSLARASGQSALAAEIQIREQLYRNGQAYHPYSVTPVPAAP